MRAKILTSIKVEALRKLLPIIKTVPRFISYNIVQSAILATSDSPDDVINNSREEIYVALIEPQVDLGKIYLSHVSSLTSFDFLTCRR